MILGEYCSPPFTLRMIPRVEVINLNLVTKGGAFWKFFLNVRHVTPLLSLLTWHSFSK